MDNVTHTLTGWMLSRAGLDRWHPRASLILMLSANAPDLDVITAAGGAINYLHFHRGWTHSIAVAPAVAVLPVLVALAFARSMRGWLAAYALSLIGVASHLLLDWTNSYGIRLFLPFSSAWPHLDWTNVVDLWILVALVLGVVSPMMGRLVSSEIGAKPGKGRSPAIAALLLVLAIEFGHYLAHQRALETLNSRIYRGAAPIRVAAFPASVANPLRWNGWVQGDGFATHYHLDLATPFDPSAGDTIYPTDPSPALDAARHTQVFQTFLEFSQYPIWRVLPADDPEGAVQVDLSDWRFAFTASATVDRANRVLQSRFSFGLAR